MSLAGESSFRFLLAGAIVSAAAHSGLAWVLALSLQTEPVPVVPEPAAGISFTLHGGRKDRLAPADPGGDSLGDTVPTPGAAPLATPPRSRAAAGPLSEQPLAASAADGEPVAASPGQGVPAAAAAPPGEDLAAVTTAADRLAPRPPSFARTQAAAIAGDALAAAEYQTHAPLQAAVPSLSAVAPSPARATVVAAAASKAASPSTVDPASTPVDATAPEPARLTAGAVAPAHVEALAAPAPPVRAGAPTSTRAEAVDFTPPALAAHPPAAQAAVSVAAPHLGLAPAPAAPDPLAADMQPGIRLEVASSDQARPVLATDAASAADPAIALAPHGPPILPDASSPEALEPVEAPSTHVQVAAPPAKVHAARTGEDTATALLAAAPASAVADVAPGSVAGSRLPPARQPRAELAPTLPPAAPVTGSATDAPRAEPARAAAVAAPSTPAPALSVPSTTPSAEPRQAALAWSGDGSARLDPKSFDAIQSFMAPTAAAEDSVRDRLGGALAGIPCSRLTAAFSPATGAIAVRGHARDVAAAVRAVDSVRSAVGASIPVEDDLLILPEPQCRLLEAIEAAGLPQSTDQADDPLVVGRAAQLSYQPFEDGEPMTFSLGAADFDGYLYVDYFDAAGSVVHVTPSELVPLRVLGTGEEIRLGGTGSEGIGVHMTAAPPFGKDILVAIAVSQPLFAGPRPMREEGLAYLADLRRAVAARASDPEFRGEWVYIFVETFPQGRRPSREPSSNSAQGT